MTAQQLKNSILQMAVQGKLVPQDPNDEPASVLLERIRAEKEQLIKQKKIKREKNPSVIFKGADNTPYEKIGDEMVSLEAEVPFEIPESWEWMRLIDACEYIQRGKSPKYSPIKKYPVIAQKCNQWSGFSIDKAQFIEPDSIGSYGSERILQDRDLLWNSTGLGTLGRMAIFRTELNPYELAVADSHVTVIRPLKDLVLPEYLYYYFASPCVQNVIEDKADGSTKQKELATATIKAYLVPLPPLEEQRRILRKIAEVLPALSEYDTVEQRNSRLNAEFPDRLKKSILQEAVQGKLVPQNPEDEPASILLERIRTEKEALIKAGKIKRDKHESVIFRRDNSHYEKLDGIERCIDEEIPFEIPENWAWTRIRNICEAIVDCPHSTPKYYTEDTGYYSIDTTCIESDGRLSGLRYTDQHAYEERTTRLIPKENDIVYTREGSIGRAALLPHIDNLCLGQRVMLLRLSAFADNRLYQYVLMSPLVLDAITSKIRGIGAKHINVSDVCNALIPVPPIAEQRRIVTALQNSLVLVNKV